MSENGDEKQQGRRRGNSNEKELASQQIQIQSKRFYIDVKENQRGRFIKLAEVGVGGRKSRILMSMNAAQEFKNRLAEFSDLHSQLGPSHGGTSDSSNNNGNGDNNKGDNKDNDGLIKSETFIKDRKRYYLDLKENQRGRFLRVSMVGPGPRGPRTQVAIPAQGLIEFKDHLNDMLERYDNTSSNDENGIHNQSSSANNQHQSNDNQTSSSSDGKSLRADNKTFYFDHGSNQRGTFLKISEVRQNRYRTSITIPEKYLKQFRDNLNEFVEKAEKNSSDSSNEQSNKQTVASIVASGAQSSSSDKKSDEKK